MRLQSNTVLKFAIYFAVAMSLISFSSASRAQQGARLSKIQFTGLKRLTSDQLIALSGLQMGQQIDPAALDAAAGKLIQSGLFRHLSYRVHAADGEATVTFEVEESAINLPVFFENFVWFSDEELTEAIRKDVPFFDGAAPATGDTTDKIAAALQRLLASRNITARVEYMPYVSKDKQELLFTVKGARIRVCSLHFPGASAISEAELVKASQQILTADYSRKDIATFAPVALLPLYHHRGYLQAEFQAPAVALASGSQCASGVDVTIPVNEGSVYYWAGSEWNGNEKLTVDDLAAALGMNPGEIADGAKIQKGLREVRRAYARRGYMEAEIKETIEFAEGAPRVRYVFNINEGPRYFMGNLIVNGVTAAQAEELKSKWTLGANAVFDESYIEQFRQNVLRDFVTSLAQRSGARSKIEVETRPNRQTRTIDVIISFR